MATQTVKFKGEFDVSGIINSIKQMRTELAKQDSPLLGNLDKEITKLEGLGTTIKAQMEKGFASNKEFKSFQSSVEKMELSVGKIGQKFKEINADNLEIATKKINESLEETKKKAQEIQAAFKKNFSESMSSIAKDSKEVNKELVEMARQGKSFNEAQERAKELYDERIKRTRELIALQKELVNNAKAEVAVSTQGLNRADFEIKGKRGNDRKINDETFSRIQSAWNDSVKNATGRQDLQDRFKNALSQINKELGITITREGKARAQNQALTNSWVQYTNALKESNDAANQHAKRLSSLENQENALLGEKSSYIAALQTEKGSYEQAANAARKAGQAEQEANKEKAEAAALNEREKSSIDAINNSINRQVDAFKKDAVATQEAVKSQENLNSSLDMLKSRVAYVLSISNAFYQVKRAVTETLSDISNIDKAFASIAMVTDKTISGLWQRYGEYAQMAQKLGQSTESAIKASALFYQQGLKDAEVMQLTEETMKLATLAGLDFEQATSQMTAALRGFHMEMDQGAHITDVYSELAAHAAADVNGIAYAMSKTASIANNAGMSFENTAAFLTQMIETTQEAPENIGTAMKTIIARFTELKQNIAGTAESEFEDLDYNKVDKALKSVGVSIKDATGQFRNLDEVFLELSEKWNTLDRNSQRYIATIAAGSRQQSRFIAMMENYDRTMELVNITQDAQGRSQQQFEKNAESLSFKLQALKTSWEQLRISFLDSSFLKGIVDKVTNLTDAFGKMDGKQIATLGIIGVTIGRKVISNLVESIKSSTNEVYGVGKTLKESFIKGWNSTKNFNNEIISKQSITNIQRAKRELQKVAAEGVKITTADAKIYSAYQEIQNKITEINQEITKITTNEKGEITPLEELDEVEQERVNKLKQENELLEIQKQKIEKINSERTNSNIDLTNPNNPSLLPKKDDPSKVSLSQIGAAAVPGLKGAASSAVSMGLTSAVMMAVGGADFSQVIQTAATSAIIGAMPGIISAVSASLKTALAPVIAEIGAAFAAIPAAVVAAVAVALIAIAAIGYGIYKIHKANEAVEQAELNRLKNVEQRQKEIDQEYQEHSQEYKTAKNNLDNFTNAIERYEKLSNKTFRNSKEEEEFGQLYEKITTDYSEVVDAQDDNTKELVLNTEAIRVLTEKYTDEMKEAKASMRAANLDKAINAAFKFKATNKAVDAYINYINPTKKETAKSFKNGFRTYDDRTGLHETYTYGGRTFDYESDWRNIKEKLLAIDSNILKNIGSDFQLSDLDSIESFNNYLEKAGMTVDDFGEKLKTQNERFNTEEKAVKQIRQAAKNEYMSKDIEGLNVTDQLANMLTSKITSSNFVDSNSINIKTLDRDLTNWDRDKKSLRAARKGNFSDLFSDSAAASAYEQFLSDKSINAYDFFSDGKPGSKVVGTNLAKWESLPDDFREWLQGRGYSQSGWEDVRKISSSSKQVLYNYMKERAAAQMNVLQDVSDEDLATYSEQLNQLSKLYQNSTGLTQDEYNKQLNNISAKFNDSLRERVNEYEKQDGSINQQFEKNLEEFKKLGLNDNFTKNLTLEVQNAILQTVKDMNLTTEKSGEMAKVIESVLLPLSEEAKKVLLGIDFSEGYGTIMAQSKDYINALVDTGYDLEDATKIFKNYVDQAYNVIMRFGMGSAGADRMVTILKQTQGGFAEENEKIIAAQKEYFENGAISGKTYYDLLNNGFEDYVKTTSKGFELLGNKSEKFITDGALKPLQDLDAEIEHQQNMTDKFNGLGVSSIHVKTQYSELGEDLYNKAKSYGADWTYDGRANFDDKTLINMLKEDPETFNEIAKILHLTDNEIEAISIAASNGATSLSNFRSEVQAYNSTLKASRPEIYIASLVNISEALQATADKTKELKDKVEELNKEYEKNKEALQDAEEALHKAIHGDEFYKSGLDGLINYNNELKNTNDLIDDIKDGLEDVDNVQDSTNMFNQLSEGYDKRVGNLYAQNAVIDKSLANIKDTLLSKYGDFVKFDGENMVIDFSYKTMDGNDEYKKTFEQLTKTYSDELQLKRNNTKTAKDTLKEREKYEKDFLKKYTDVQKDVIDVLKAAAEEELKTTQEKYDALKEADDDYINALEEAIQKQRDLRDRENSEEELAQKEKKLSLMQRDTSGANAKDIQKLEKDIEDDREKLLDQSIDTIINDMKEVYEKQAEARDAEIEYMEAVTENAQYFNEWAQNIVSSWQSVEDMQGWFLDNNPEVEEMTTEKTELYLKDLEDKWTDLVNYQGLKAADFKSNSEIIDAEMTTLYQSTSENISGIGTELQANAEKTVEDLIKQAQKARDSAKDALDETEKKLAEAQQQLQSLENQSVQEHKAAMDEMVKASESGIRDVSIFAVTEMAQLEGVDLKDKEAAEQFAQDHNWKNSSGQYSESFRQAVKNAGGDISEYQDTYQYKIMGVEQRFNAVPGMIGSYYGTESDTKAAMEVLKAENPNYSYYIVKDQGTAKYGSVSKYATGGLVPYTGIAQVDGTPSRPEAFLSAEDTQRFLTAAELLAMSPLLNSSSAQNAVSSSIGDTSIEININVESISDDYDVDRLIKRVEDDINETARPVGTQVILNKRV